MARRIFRETRVRNRNRQMNIKNSPFSVSCMTQSPLEATSKFESLNEGQVGRRSFLKGLSMAGATLLPGGALLISKAEANQLGDRDGRRRLTKGDAAILR